MSFFEDWLYKFDEETTLWEEKREERFQKFKEFLKSSEKEAKIAKKNKKPFILNAVNISLLEQSIRFKIREQLIHLTDGETSGRRPKQKILEVNYDEADKENSTLTAATINEKAGQLTQSTREVTICRKAKLKALDCISTIAVENNSLNDIPRSTTNTDQTKILHPILQNPSYIVKKEDKEEENRTLKAEETLINANEKRDQEEDILINANEKSQEDKIIHSKEKISSEILIVKNKSDQSENDENPSSAPTTPPAEASDSEKTNDKVIDVDQQEERVPIITVESDNDNCKTKTTESQHQDLIGKTDGTPEINSIGISSGSASGGVKSAIPIFKKARIEYRCKGQLNKENSTPAVQHSKGLLQATPTSQNSKLLHSASNSTKKHRLLKEVEKRRKREEEMKQKVEEASKLKEELIKSKMEELKRKREEKQQKVIATREAVEREKHKQLQILEQKKKEKAGQTKAEAEKLKEEQILKKKQLNLQKAREAEERRQREENARLARLKEQEEEQKRLTEIKIKLKMEAEKLQQQRRLEEEMRAKKVKIVKPSSEKVKPIQNKDGDNNSYEVPSSSQMNPLATPVDYCNYDIADLNLEESEDEEHPRKVIPEWAKRSVRNENLKIFSYIPMNIVTSFFTCPSKTPDLRKMFGECVRKRIRTSSAVWLNPPSAPNSRSFI